MKNEKLIRDFLFGELPEAERFEYEERFIKDADLYQQIKIVEDELIENYVRGFMNPAELLKFEQNFLTSKKRREKVEFSRLLLEKIQSKDAEIAVFKQTGEQVSDESFWQKLAEIFLTPKIAMATAFAILIAVFGSWFLYQNSNSNKPELAQTTVSNAAQTPKPTQNSTPEITTTQTPDESEQTQNESEEDDADNSLIKEIPKQSPKVTERIVQKTPTPTPEVSVPNPVLALFAGRLRSEGKNNVLKLPENANGATLQLNLDAADYKTYQLNITDANGNVIFRQKGLKAKKTKINIFVPPENLRKGDYLIKLFGKNDAGENESAADFQFRVD